MFRRIESGIAGKGLGANFPLHIRALANGLGLKGAVVLKEDGSLKIIAEGEEANLEKFAKAISKGSFLSQIENFYVIWHEPKDEFLYLLNK